MLYGTPARDRPASGPYDTGAPAEFSSHSFSSVNKVPVGVTGLEPVDVNCLHTNDLQTFELSAGAESGALGTRTPTITPELQAIIDAWPTLPKSLRDGIVAMVRASRNEK